MCHLKIPPSPVVLLLSTKVSLVIRSLDVRSFQFCLKCGLSCRPVGPKRRFWSVADGSTVHCTCTRAELSVSINDCNIRCRKVTGQREPRDRVMTPFFSLHTHMISIRITHESPVQIMTHFRSPHTRDDSCYLPPYRWHILNLEAPLSTLTSYSGRTVCLSCHQESGVCEAKWRCKMRSLV